eukprot:gene3570-3644_t
MLGEHDSSKPLWLATDIWDSETRGRSKLARRINGTLVDGKGRTGVRIVDLDQGD